MLFNIVCTLTLISSEYSVYAVWFCTFAPFILRFLRRNLRYKILLDMAGFFSVLFFFLLLDFSVIKKL